GNVGVLTADGRGQTDTATFTCPGTPEDDILKLVVSDGPTDGGASCPASDTTGTVVVACRACWGMGTSDVAEPNTAIGACPAGQVNTAALPNAVALRDGAGNYCCSAAPAACAQAALTPCTKPGQTCCVRCSGAPDGLCTPTEALFVAHDIAG